MWVKCPSLCVRARPCVIWPLHVRIRGNWAENVSTLLKDGAIVRYLGDTGTKMAPWVCWDFKPSNEGSFVAIGQEMTKLGWKVWKKSLQSLRAELQSLRAESIAVCMQWWSFRRRSLSWGNLLRLVRNESSCSPWSFSAPSSEDLAWTSNQVDPTRFFMIFHADHTCSWESRWRANTQERRICCGSEWVWRHETLMVVVYGTIKLCMKPWLTCAIFQLFGPSAAFIRGRLICNVLTLQNSYKQSRTCTVEANHCQCCDFFKCQQTLEYKSVWCARGIRI